MAKATGGKKGAAGQSGKNAIAKKQTAGNVTQTQKRAAAKKKGKDVVSAEVMDTEQCRKRRQIQRRNTEEQCARFQERKLSHIDQVRLRTLRNEEGQSIEQFICDELRTKRCKQGRLSAKFLVRLYKSFNLASDTWDALPRPPADGEHDEELAQLISLCHDENKFTRDTSPLCAHLETCAELDIGPLLSLLHGSLAGPLLDEGNASKVQNAVLHYMARFSVNTKYPDVFDIVKHQLGESFKTHVQQSLSDGARTKRILKNCRDI